MHALINRDGNAQCATCGGPLEEFMIVTDDGRAVCSGACKVRGRAIAPGQPDAPTERLDVRRTWWKRLLRYKARERRAWWKRLFTRFTRRRA